MRYSLLSIILFVCLTSGAQKNYISNGDFENGNIGFTSDYQFIPLGVSAHGIREYFIYHDANALRYQWNCTGKGNFMLVDGALEKQISFWKQSVSLNPTKKYLLRFDVALLSPATYSPGVGVKVYNNNKLIATIDAPTEMHKWKVNEIIVEDFKAKNNVLHFETKINTAGGNDFAIDNIMLKVLKAGYKPKTTYYAGDISKGEQVEKNQEEKIATVSVNNGDEFTPPRVEVLHEGIKDENLEDQIPTFIVKKDTVFIEIENIDEEAEIMLSIASLDRKRLLKEETIKRSYMFKYSFPPGVDTENLKLILHDNEIKRVNVTIDGVTKYFILNRSSPPVSFILKRK